jgi:glycosyltransferase involved in cell wall biosynthesis
MEGGANVVCEALRVGVPVLASRIPGNVGLLGKTYPAYFALEDEKALAELVHRTATDKKFYRRIKRAVERLRPMVAPRAEARALLDALKADPSGSRS